MVMILIYIALVGADGQRRTTGSMTTLPAALLSTKLLRCEAIQRGDFDYIFTKLTSNI